MGETPCPDRRTQMLVLSIEAARLLELAVTAWPWEYREDCGEIRDANSYTVARSVDEDEGPLIAAAPTLAARVIELESLMGRAAAPLPDTAATPVDEFDEPHKWAGNVGVSGE